MKTKYYGIILSLFLMVFTAMAEKKKDDVNDKILEELNHLNSIELQRKYVINLQETDYKRFKELALIYAKDINAPTHIKLMFLKRVGEQIIHSRNQPTKEQVDFFRVLYSAGFGRTNDYKYMKESMAYYKKVIPYYNFWNAVFAGKLSKNDLDDFHSYATKTPLERWEIYFIRNNMIYKNPCYKLGLVYVRSPKISQAYFNTLIKLLSYDDPGVRMGAIKLLKLEYKDGPDFNPVAPLASRQKSVAKWNVYVIANNYDERKKRELRERRARRKAERLKQEKKK